MFQKLLLIITIGVFSISFSQEKLNYVQGEVLFQLNPKYSIRNLERDLTQAGPLNGKQFRTELISKNVNIYLLSFDTDYTSHAYLLEYLDFKKEIIACQNNHYVQSRATTPNDPEFSNQWQFENTGQTGGTAGADISATDAWDITTGGLTAHGDTIVVCVIEEQGGNLTLPDLAPNAWKNNHEIPNNGIDDDNNGYIDDVEGWNVQTFSDDIGNGQHGTQVSSVIGAKGNNNDGGSGINWDVQIMMIRGVIPSSESTVLAAYDYPLTMRKQYNQSNGSLGAFVVATNASWGVDNADPASFPLWCNFYDSLGLHGILNVGATANNNVDIDVVGDMPTACGSDYLMSITSSDHNDNRASAGYGLTTIDLAAPGQSVYMLGSNNTWGTSSGTSFATPAVAGTIALMYSIDCPSFMALAKSDPGAAVLMVKQSIMDGVDIIPGMNGESVTGGRLNAFNALNELGDQCDTNECSYAYSVQISSITDTSATINWDGISDSYWFYFKESSASLYDSILLDTNYALIDSLDFCTPYDFYLITDCDTALSNPTNIYSFTSEGCCENPDIMIDTVAATSISLYWESILTVNDYDLRYRITGTTTWTDIMGITDTFRVISGLDSCQFYDIQIKTNCSQIMTTYSTTTEIKTKGCGACYDQTYCSVQAGNSNLEWIEKVDLNTMSYTSGNNNGYLFTDTVTTYLEPGTQYTLAITPDYAGFAFTENFGAWIDFDQNGVFDASEMVLAGFENGVITDVFTVPINAQLGQTRMRITMVGQAGGGNPCPTNQISGEIEEYCIWISEDAAISELDNKNDYRIYPNPTSNFISIELNDHNPSNKIEIFDCTGKLIRLVQLSELNSKIDISALNSGIYHIRISNDNFVIGNEKIIKTKR
jgi:hypothetical protein